MKMDALKIIIKFLPIVKIYCHGKVKLVNQIKKINMLKLVDLLVPWHLPSNLPVLLSKRTALYLATIGFFKFDRKSNLSTNLI